MNTKSALEVFVGPKSICQCGHLGDGYTSDHEDGGLTKGHGKCMILGCSCERFSWKRFTPSFIEVMDNIRGKLDENNTLENNL